MLSLTELPWELYPGYAAYFGIPMVCVVKMTQLPSQGVLRVWKLLFPSQQGGRRKSKQLHVDLDIRQGISLSYENFPEVVAVHGQMRSTMITSFVSLSWYLSPIQLEYKRLWEFMHCVKWAEVARTKWNLTDFRRNLNMKILKVI